MGELLFCFTLNKLDKGVQFASVHSSKLPAWDVFVLCGGAEGSVANGWVSPVWESESRLDLFIPHQLCPARPRVRGLGVTDTGPLTISHLPIQTVQQPGLGNCIKSKPPTTLFRNCNGNALVSTCANLIISTTTRYNI